jgi:hypothetical protein
VKNPRSGLPCIHESLKDIVLFRTKTDPLSRKPYRLLAREDVFLRPALDAVRSRAGPWIKIHLSQGPRAIPLLVLPFDQNKAVSLVAPDSEQAKLYAHTYALGPDARNQVEKFLARSYGKYIDFYLDKEENSVDLDVFRAAAVESRLRSVELASYWTSSSAWIQN